MHPVAVMRCNLQKIKTINLITDKLFCFPANWKCWIKASCHDEPQWATTAITHLVPQKAYFNNIYWWLSVWKRQMSRNVTDTQIHAEIPADFLTTGCLCLCSECRWSETPGTCPYRSVPPCSRCPTLPAPPLPPGAAWCPALSVCHQAGSSCSHTRTWVSKHTKCRNQKQRVRQKSNFTHFPTCVRHLGITKQLINWLGAQIQTCWLKIGTISRK